MKKNLGKKTYRWVKQQGFGEQNVRIGRENNPGIDQDHDDPEQRRQTGRAQESPLNFTFIDREPPLGQEPG